MRSKLRENGLLLAMSGLFAASVIGQLFTGLHEHNAEAAAHGRAVLGVGAYLTSGHFIEAVFENWESEFLQMGLFVLLTVVLRQKGSPESKRIDGDEEVDARPDRARSGAPWPVRVGGFVGRIYEHSLSLALLGLFVISFALHVVTGAAAYSEEQRAHGETAVSAMEYLTTPQLWFESFQNWQSEFMSIGALVVLSVFLRQKGSPESKPVDASVSKTGG